MTTETLLFGKKKSWWKAAAKYYRSMVSSEGLTDKEIEHLFRYAAYESGFLGDPHCYDKALEVMDYWECNPSAATLLFGEHD